MTVLLNKKKDGDKFNDIEFVALLTMGVENMEKQIIPNPSLKPINYDEIIVFKNEKDRFDLFVCKSNGYTHYYLGYFKN